MLKPIEFEAESNSFEKNKFCQRKRMNNIRSNLCLPILNEIDRFYILLFIDFLNLQVFYIKLFLFEDFIVEKQMIYPTDFGAYHSHTD